MAWTDVEWSCGHCGSIQLYGKASARRARVAYEAGKKCMACWLVEQWEKRNDIRAQKENRYQLAADIAEDNGKRISVDDCVPVTTAHNPLANFSIDELQAEIERRK